MAGVNIDSIMKKVNAFAESDVGKERMKKRINDIRKGGGTKTEGGGRITSFKEMHAAAREMERTAKETAAAHKLPQSVQDHFDTLYHEPPVQVGEGMYRMDLYFHSDLGRPSLLINDGPRKGQHTGEGINNIVSLFDTGYIAHNQVFGIWEGHEMFGPISSRVFRNSIGFMKEAVTDFNRRFGNRYGVTAMLSDEWPDAEYYSR